MRLFHHFPGFNRLESGAEVVAAFGEQRFCESMLITHRGLSGPAILQISSYWNNGEPVRIDLAPGRDVTATMRICEPTIESMLPIQRRRKSRCPKATQGDGRGLTCQSPRALGADALEGTSV